ncbi:MAG: ABC transporter ATP-binding protein [Solirubrobacteraceae bacterium]|nr:ABC transporter ATP-binding protein [Solirubrobacteraceae bacterium]
MTAAHLLKAEGVRVEIAGLEIVEHADLELTAGRILAIVGPNGAGKSTLARALVGLQGAAGGSIAWAGKPLGKWRRRELARTRAFVPQRAPVSAGLTTRDAVAMGRAPHLGALQRPTAKDAAIVERAIARSGVEHLAERSLATLSGGELQRVRLAVALAQETPAIVLDEPTASLDLGAAAEMGRLLHDLAAEGLAVLVVVHDLALAAAIADEVVIVDRGRTVAHGEPADVLTSERLLETWGAAATLDIRRGATVFEVDWLASGARPEGAASTEGGLA